MPRPEVANITVGNVLSSAYPVLCTQACEPEHVATFLANAPNLYTVYLITWIISYDHLVAGWYGEMLLFPTSQDTYCNILMRLQIIPTCSTGLRVLISMYCNLYCPPFHRSLSLFSYNKLSYTVTGLVTRATVVFRVAVKSTSTVYDPSDLSHSQLLASTFLKHSCAHHIEISRTNV